MQLPCQVKAIRAKQFGAKNAPLIENEITIFPIKYQACFYFKHALIFIVENFFPFFPVFYQQIQNTP